MSEEKQIPSFILLVHGEVLIRTPLAAHLRGRGYTVFESSDAEEAVIVLKEPDLLVDLVFCDSEMRGEMDGVTLEQWVRDNRPETKIVLAASPTRNESAQLAEGATIKKPYDPAAVGDLIERLLAETS